MSSISSLASVSSASKIGKNVIIEPFVMIHEDVEIGEGTVIHSGATLMPGTRIGKECRIFSGAVIGAVPQDLKFENEYTTVTIGNHTTVRECVTINRGTKESGNTALGNHCLIMAYSHVAHDCVIGDHCILSNGTQLAGHVVLGEWAIMGGLSGALQKTRIGKHAFISGGTLISKDIPPYIKVIYTPGHYAGINTLGLLRRGYTREQMQYISDIYKIIYYSDLNTSQAVETIKKEISNAPEKEEILQFIESSKKGIIAHHAQSQHDANKPTEDF